MPLNGGAEKSPVSVNPIPRLLTTGVNVTWLAAGLNTVLPAKLVVYTGTPFSGGPNVKSTPPIEQTTAVTTSCRVPAQGVAEAKVDFGSMVRTNSSAAKQVLLVICTLLDRLADSQSDKGKSPRGVEHV